jgi:rhodanese-related sulfurtransferase
LTQATQITEISANDAHQLASSGAATLVDVREPFEWETGSAAGALRMRMSTLSARHVELPKDQPVLLICASGGRSYNAAAFLVEQGFDARSVAGGTAGWVASMLPIDA